MPKIRLLSFCCIISLFFSVPIKSNITPATTGEKLIGSVEQMNADHDNWTVQETFVWDQICKGKEALLLDTKDKSNAAIQKALKNWTDEKVLRSEFLQNILQEPYYSSITQKGIIIIGAWIKEPLALSNATFSLPLMFINCRFDASLDLTEFEAEKGVYFIKSEFHGPIEMSKLYAKNFDVHDSNFESSVNLRSAEIEGYLNASGASFKKNLDMDNINIKDSLFMRNGASFEKEVILNSASIGEHVDMSGASFNSLLNMDNIKIKGSLFMRDGASFEQVVALNGEIGNGVEIDHSTFKELLNMRNIEISGSLTISNVASFEKDVQLDSAVIGKTITILNSTFRGQLTMDKASVKSSLFMHEKSIFEKNVVLTSAKIGGQLNLNNSIFKSKFSMETINIQSGIIISNGCIFDSEVNLVSAESAGNINIIGSTFKGNLNMTYLSIKGSLNIVEGNVFDGPINILYARIEGNLYLIESTVKYLDLTSTRINQELNIGSERLKPPKWGEDAKLILQNTSTEILQDMPNSWPENINIKGFTYSQFEGFGSSGNNSIVTRDILWMNNWLNKQKQFSPQPYQQLAKVLINEGYPKIATKILYSGKERERSNSNGLRWILLTLQKLIIGYGYYNIRSIYWSLFFIMLGWLFSMRQKSKEKLWCLIYSIDLFLPIIELDKKNYEISLEGSVKYYFYAHKIIGYILISFFIAGLSGLTK